MSDSKHSCTCGKIFRNKRCLNAHRDQSCPDTKMNRERFICSYCSSEYNHQSSLSRHLNICSSRPVHTDSSCNVPQPNHVEQTATMASGNHNISNISHSTIDTGHNDNSTHNTLNDNSVSNYNINYFPNLDPKHIFDIFLTKFGPKYISQGENGLYEFIFCEIFTDPEDSSKTSIICIDYKEEIFHYGSLNKDGVPIVREDISLSEFNKYLKNFNGLIRTLVTKTSDFTSGLLNTRSCDMQKNLDALVNAMTSRKKMPSYIANKIRLRMHNDNHINDVVSEDILKMWLEEGEKKGIACYQTHVPTERELKANEDLKIRDRLLTPEKIEQRKIILEKNKKKVMKNVTKRITLKTKKLRISDTINEEVE